MEAAIPFAKADLKIWLESVLEALRDREHLSTVKKAKIPARKPK